MAGIWRHNGEWVSDPSLLSPDGSPGAGGRDANAWFGNSLLWDDGTGNADTGVFGTDPQRLGGSTAGFDITGASAGVPSPPLPPVMPPQIIAPGDVVYLTVNELAPPVPNGPSPPAIPPLPPVPPPNTPPVDMTHWYVNQVPPLSPDASLSPSTPPQQLTGVPTGTDPTLLGIPNR